MDDTTTVHRLERFETDLRKAAARVAAAEAGLGLMFRRETVATAQADMAALVGLTSERRDLELRLIAAKIGLLKSRRRLLLALEKGEDNV
ncbi:MAG: hypothetical protein JWQ02_1036 [Capsulimonas sp.]|nr:hypothetical protein [Capsulimonas sp.]